MIREQMPEPGRSQDRIQPIVSILRETRQYSRALKERGRHDQMRGMMLFLISGLLLLSLLALLLASSGHLRPNGVDGAHRSAMSPVRSSLRWCTAGLPVRRSMRPVAS